MKTYKTYLFDADGTLLDTTELIYQSFLNTFRIYGGFDVSREAIYSDIGIPLLPQMKKHLGERSPEEYDEILEVHRDYQKSIYHETLRLYDGVKEGLEELKRRKVSMGIVTSRNRDSLDRYLKHTDIYRYFEVIATPENTENHKPHPEPVLWAMKELAARREETLFTGDAVFDIISGRDAGVDTALVTWGHNKPENIDAEPTWLLNDFKDLLW